jgi:hypothetical protein
MSIQRTKVVIIQQLKSRNRSNNSGILLDRLATSVIRWRSLSLENRASRSLRFDLIATTQANRG